MKYDKAGKGLLSSKSEHKLLLFLNHARLRPHRLQHARLPYPSPSPGVWLEWGYPSTSSSVSPFFCLQSFLESGSFPMSWHFTSDGRSIGTWAKYSGLISFRMDWLDLLAVQGTLKSLLQHHSSEALILRCSAFFVVQLSHLYITTGKTIALIVRTFVSKLMSLLFNMLSRFVIAFLPRSMYVLISCCTHHPQWFWCPRR